MRDVCRRTSTDCDVRGRSSTYVRERMSTYVDACGRVRKIFQKLTRVVEMLKTRTLNFSGNVTTKCKIKFSTFGNISQKVKRSLFWGTRPRSVKLKLALFLGPALGMGVGPGQGFP